MQIEGMLAVAGVEASQLRKQRYELLRGYGIPNTVLSGSVGLVVRRCGKGNCHCSQAGSDGHSQWRLVTRIDDRRVCIPLSGALAAEAKELIARRQQVEAAVQQVGRINARLLQLGRYGSLGRAYNIPWRRR